MGRPLVLGIIILLQARNMFGAEVASTIQPGHPPYVAMEPKGGMIFAKHDDLIITGQSWSVITHIDINGYTKQLRRLQGMTAVLMITADRNHTDPTDDIMTKAQAAHYKNVLIRCSADLEILNEIKRSMNSQNPTITPSNRTRRGFGTGIGTILHLLFGLSTDKQYKQVNNLVSDQKYKLKELAHINQAQASILNQSYTHLRTTDQHLETLEKNFEVVQKRLTTAYEKDRDHVDARLHFMAANSIQQSTVDLVYDILQVGSSGELVNT
jgi:hypothetical protein